MNTITLQPSVKKIVDSGVGVLITPAGGYDVVNVVPPTVEHEGDMVFGLSGLYNAIGCDSIELVDVPDTEYILVCDEEGLWNNPTLNIEATELAGRPIVGNVLLCHTSKVP